jgi:hypothetical protein
MNTVSEWVWESGRALFQMLMSDVTAPHAVTTFTLLNLLALYAIGRSARVSRVVALWMMACLSIVLWILCVATLSRLPAPADCPSCQAQYAQVQSTPAPVG